MRARWIDLRVKATKPKTTKEHNKVMAKATKKRTRAKSLPRKKALSAADMKKVKGGITANSPIAHVPKLIDPGPGLLLPALQKIVKY